MRVAWWNLFRRPHSNSFFCRWHETASADCYPRSRNPSDQWNPSPVSPLTRLTTMAF